MEKHPPLTIEAFYEKSVALSDVYRNNVEVMNRDFMEKQKKLFDRLSAEDQEEVRRRELAKLQEQASRVMAPMQGLVDPMGRKITTH